MSRPTTVSSQEDWSTTASTYSSNVGRTSALSAARLLELVHNTSPISSTSKVLDNGAGTGAVTFALASQFPSAHILATDISASMLENISAANLPNVTTKVLDARSLSQGLQPGTFTHAFNTFVLQTIINPSSAIREMHTVLAPTGIIGIALWAQRNGPFEIWERACQTLDPSYTLPSPFDDPHAWRTCEELERALKDAGFTDIKTEEVTMPFPFEGAAEFTDFWFGARNPGPERCMSNWNGDRDKIKTVVEHVCKEAFADGREIYTSAVLGLGRKEGGGKTSCDP
ncbi:MAG: hypothetical protein LQ338_003996 [Usnochroma carphineum]|nr:MAG: hypothetical protein LQ338_003996 [Usnochroma carphineum]